MGHELKIKTVHGCRYFWNRYKNRWEGLINNACKLPKTIKKYER